MTDHDFRREIVGPEVEAHPLKLHFPGESARNHPRGAMVFHQGEPAERVFLLLDGNISLVAMTESGREIEVTTIVAGQLFGVPAICLATYPTSAVATRRVRVVGCCRDRIRESVSRDPALAMTLMCHLAGQLSRIIERLPELCCRTTHERVAMYLIRQQDAVASICLPRGSRVQMARHLGMQQETLSRALRHLEDAGLIGVVPGGIQVLDADGLKEFAEGDRHRHRS